MTVWVGGAGPLELVWRGDERRSFGGRALCKTASGDAVLCIANLRPSATSGPRSAISMNVRTLVVDPLPLGAMDVVLSNAPGFRLFGIDRTGKAESCTLRPAAPACKETVGSLKYDGRLCE